MSLEESASIIADSSYFKFVSKIRIVIAKVNTQIMSFNIITSCCGIVALTLMERGRKTRKTLAHKSLTMLMDAHSFWTFLLCLSTFVHNSTTMYAHLTMSAPSDIIVSASTCAMRRTLSMVAIFGSVFSQMAMAVERCQASKNVGTYESTNPSIGRILNAAHIVAVLLFWIVQINIYGADWNWSTAHCALVNPSQLAVNSITAAFVFLCELAIIIVFKRLLARNNRLRDSNDAGLTLSKKYQLAENIRMLKLLSPTIWTHTSFAMIGGVLFFVMQAIFPSPEMYPLIEETINMTHLQGICIPLIYLLRFRHQLPMQSKPRGINHFREQKRRTKQMFKVNATRGAELASHHAKAITEGW